MNMTTFALRNSYSLNEGNAVQNSTLLNFPHACAKIQRLERTQSDTHFPSESYALHLLADNLYTIDNGVDQVRGAFEM